MADARLFKIHYTDRSIADASTIKQYLLYKFTQKEVDRFYGMLSEFENIVSTFPKLYPKSVKSKIVRRAVLSKQLSVFYVDSNDTILIIAIRDNRMDSSKWPK
jgi:plasmid stabilization system protein ParE